VNTTIRFPGLVFGLTLLSGFAFVDCSPSPHSPQPPGAGSPASLFTQRACNNNNDCTNYPAPDCLAWLAVNPCDLATHRCKANLRAGKQCAAGNRWCVTPNVPQGVQQCDTTTCDWATTCTGCGAQSQPCCPGGCQTGLLCKSSVGAVLLDGTGNCNP
jgi:hypothetical protein